MALSRPGAAATRVFTSLGFASFELDGGIGAGMFECSKSVNATDSPKPDSSGNGLGEQE